MEDGGTHICSYLQISVDTAIGIASHEIGDFAESDGEPQGCKVV